MRSQRTALRTICRLNDSPVPDCAYSRGKEMCCQEVNGVRFMVTKVGAENETKARLWRKTYSKYLHRKQNNPPLRRNRIATYPLRCLLCTRHRKQMNTCSAPEARHTLDYPNRQPNRRSELER
jgi:hypothetical protein